MEKGRSHLSHPDNSSLSPFESGLKAVCPRCGKGDLYKSLLVPADKCNACDLDYAFIDSGDGPVVVVIFILGLVTMGLALLVESVFGPPLWVHALIWTPIVIFVCIWSLRFAKAMMIALQYRSDAQQNIEIKRD